MYHKEETLYYYIASCSSWAWWWGWRCYIHFELLVWTTTLWTQRVLFLDKEIHFLDSCILSIPNLLHHPTISISPRSLVLHYHWGASTLNNTHAYCCLSTFKTPGFCPYLQRKKSTLEKVKNLGSILHHPPPTPSKKNSLFLYLEEFSIVVVDAGGSFHKYACAIGE